MSFFYTTYLYLYTTCIKIIALFCISNCLSLHFPCLISLLIGTAVFFASITTLLFAKPVHKIIGIHTIRFYSYVTIHFGDLNHGIKVLKILATYTVHENLLRGRPCNYQPVGCTWQILFSKHFHPFHITNASFLKVKCWFLINCNG